MTSDKLEGKLIRIDEIAKLLPPPDFAAVHTG